MSGLSRTPGKRVGANNPPRVRIPPSPPNKKSRLTDDLRVTSTGRSPLLIPTLTAVSRQQSIPAKNSHPPEDSLYVWGPQPPRDFVVNGAAFKPL